MRAADARRWIGTYFEIDHRGPNVPSAAVPGCLGLSRPLLRIAALGLPLLLTAVAHAASPEDEAAREAEIFGGDEPEPATMPASAPTAAEAPAKSGGRPTLRGVPAVDAPNPDLEQRLLDLGSDRLQIGGLMYLRFNVGFTDGDRIEDHRITMPNLLDVYLDARPNERVRGFVRGRLFWDPTLDESDPVNAASGASDTVVELNELWLKLDIARRLFITAGQQLVRWGATRFWNPTDVINQTQRPVLAPFDARNGVPMVKLQLPVESLGWNFYLIGLIDTMQSFDRGGVVGRAEFVVSTLEVGLVGAYRNLEGTDPVVGLDLSAGVGPIDVVAEGTLLFDERFDGNVGLQSAAGIQYPMAVFDDDMFILGFEYFYNQDGVDDVDPLELFTGQRQFFYAGRHYAALFAALPGPARLDDWSFVLSSIGNLSDQSLVLRFDVTVRVLTYLRIDAFVVGHLGSHGELRLGDEAFPPASREAARAVLGGDPTRPIPTQLVDLGLWLSIDL